MMPLVDAKKFKEKEILLPDGETLHIESCEIISTRDGFAEVKITGDCLCYKSVTHMTMAMIREAIKCREFTDGIKIAPNYRGFLFWGKDGARECVILIL